MSSTLSQSLPLQQDEPVSQHHSFEGQPCQAQSPGLFPSEFPLRVIPPGYEKHPGPRPPLKAYKEAQRWIRWHRNPHVAGLWWSAWRKAPTHYEVSLLVEEMVLWSILPECFSTAGPRDGGDQEAATARIEAFNSGAHNDLYTLRCRCCSTSREPPLLPQPSSRPESQLPLDNGSPRASPGYTSSLLHHGGDNEEDQFDSSHIPGEILLRLSLPLDPFFHMESDVATAHFARVHGVPVPRIYAFDSSAANCLGIEWQLVQKIPDEDVNFINGIMAEEEEALLKCGRKRWESGRSAAWTRLGRQLEDTLGLLRSQGRHPDRGRASASCLDRIGSLYWDFENRDFVMGPVSSHFFTRGRRILYQQRQDHDGGDPRLPLLRGPFRTVGEYLNAKLTIMLWEADDKTLRNDDKDGQPIIFKKPGCEADGTTATPAAVTSPEYASGEDEEPERTWYRNLHVDKVRDQVPKIRDIVLPWIEAKLKPEQRERVRTFISHPDLHSPNLLVSRRARARDHSGGNSNLLGEEYAVTAILDWEHTIALPDYLIQPVGVATYFRAMSDTKCCPWLSERPIHIERLLGDAGDGGRAARSPWHGECFPDPLKVSGGFVPWRRCDDDGPGHGSGAAGAVRGGGRGVRPGKAAARCVAAPPRDLTNAEVLLYFICGQLEDVVGSRSEFWVDPFVDKIQAHMASERASEPAREARERCEGE